MAERKTAKVIYQKSLSPILSIFRIAPEDGSEFPDYKSGQYIALSRDNCRLTKRVLDELGRKSYVYELDENGNPKKGTVTHSYSIASSPYETKQNGYLEFYIALEMMEPGRYGRLTESFFQIEKDVDDKLQFVNKITGEFTLDKVSQGFKNVVMVGTGTGLAPFISMLKQLQYEDHRGIHHATRFTLFHTNRTTQELGYHTELQAIEAAKRIDLLYVPTVSRPIERDYSEPTLGIGRANNILRFLFDMPLKEEQDYQTARENGGDVSKAERLLNMTVKPKLPSRLTKENILGRMNPSDTLFLTCGNPLLMGDIEYIAQRQGFRFEKEAW
ncbi:MAG: hypothetical protein HYZ34_08225 [Ignavibacteriae bacterium]|nr:hypothetical protein [Ignavibacteriota bacterium]